MHERRSVAIGFLAAALFTAAVFAQNNSRWYDPYQKGLKAFQAADWAQAVRFFEQAVAAEPRAAANKYVEGVFRIDYFPYYYLGAAYLELHQDEKAQQNFNKAMNGLSRDLIPKLATLQARLAAEKPARVVAGGSPPASAPQPPPATRPAPPPPRAPAAPTLLSEEEIFARKSVDQLNAERPLDDVFFDLGKAELQRNGKALLQKDADWLKRWANVRVTVEGRSDSRGDSAFNLALGSRRAEAVKAYLVSLGVPEFRITVVSKGKDQPFCSDSSEECFEENRRVHFLVAAK